MLRFRICRLSIVGVELLAVRVVRFAVRGFWIGFISGAFIH